MINQSCKLYYLDYQVPNILYIILVLVILLEIDLFRSPGILHILEIEVPNILCDPENIGNLKSPTFSVTLEMRAAGGRLPLLWCAVLIFWGTLFLKVCDMSNQEITLSFDLRSFGTI